VAGAGAAAGWTCIVGAAATGREVFATAARSDVTWKITTNAIRMAKARSRDREVRVRWTISSRRLVVVDILVLLFHAGSPRDALYFNRRANRERARISPMQRSALATYTQKRWRRAHLRSRQALASVALSPFGDSRHGVATNER
jgi:hypothetical protein